MHFDETVVTGEKPYKPPFWYLFDHWECVLCGKEKVYKERQWTPRPKEYWKRHIHHDTACGEHFL